MRISEIASATGVSVRSLRHCEAQRLIHALRRPNGYRDYPKLAETRCADRVAGAAPLPDHRAARQVSQLFSVSASKT
jgi:hypothetical protein